MTNHSSGFEYQQAYSFLPEFYKKNHIKFNFNQLTGEIMKKFINLSLLLPVFIPEISIL
jgi:hypothetical protein